MRSPGEEAGHSCCPPLWALSRIGDGVAEVRRAARDELRKGACQVKIMVSGGVASPSDKVTNTQFSLEEIRATGPLPALVVCHRNSMRLALERVRGRRLGLDEVPNGALVQL